MKSSLEEYMKKAIEEDFQNITKCHLSYDAKNLDADFKDDKSKEARLEILKTLKELGVKEVKSPCKSTLVFNIKKSNVKKLTECLNKKFFYSLCYVAKINNETVEFFNYSEKINDENLQNDWNSINI